tara:strand:+ start:1258 stop:1644 length:387 start_codon:yes stop_codon:yes gene_type:complete
MLQQVVMDESSGFHSVILGLRNQAKSSPFFTTFILLSIWVLVTRLRTGLEKSKRENQASTSKKKIPVLPYWIPYIGHAPEFAWSFDDLLTKGRSVATMHFLKSLIASQPYRVGGWKDNTSLHASRTSH